METRLTAEQILEKYEKIEDYHMGAGYTVEDTVSAMQEYAQQETQVLQDKLKLAVDALNGVINLKSLISYTGEIKEQHLDEAVSIDSMCEKVQETLTKLNDK